MRPDSAILAGVFGLLLFGPLAFGAVEPWSIFILEAGVAILTVKWIWRQVAKGEIVIRGNPLFPATLAFGVLVLVQLVFGLSAYRHDTISMAMLYVAYGLLAFLVTQNLRRSAQAKTLAVVISVYGFGLAAFALVQGLNSNGKLYWLKTPELGGWIYGPYVNHNHYAGLMEMLVPVPLVFCLTRYAHGRVRTIVAFGAAVMAGTIFLSGSRGGMLAFSTEMVLLGAVLLRKHRGSKGAAALGMFLAVVVGMLVWIGGDELSKRVATISTDTKSELSIGLRGTVKKDSLKMFVRKPVLGWGLGAFPTAYPQFRTFYTDLFVNEAHDDYVQLLVEMGALGVVLMLWFLVTVYRNAFRKLSDWPNDINGAVALASLLGVTGILVHSFFDFNLQIPANAAWFYVLCTIAACQITLESRPRVRKSKTRQNATELAEADAAADSPGQ
jgi:O-antigen ligase